MIATQWKDSKVLHFISTLRIADVEEVSRHRGQMLLTIACPKDIIEYQDHMDTVDRGDQKRMYGAGFLSKAHF
eukprot:5435048-Ditylum_brightwellii.AAC.1